MPIDVGLKVASTELLYQESTLCEVTVKNAGPTPVAVPSPRANPSMPSVRVLDVKTGEETVYKGQDPPGAAPRQVYEQIQPGKSLAMAFRLYHKIPLLDPGLYDVSAISEAVGAAKAESKAIRITVLPTTAKSLSTAYVAGGLSAMVYGAWVNVEADPPQIVRSRFEVLPGAFVSGVFPLAEGDIRAVPVPSAPPNGSPANSQWVGWLTGQTLCALHFDERLGASDVRKVKLAGAAMAIVPPLRTDPIRDTRVRPEGDALIMLSDPDGMAWQLDVVHLTEKKLALVKETRMTGARPVWIHSYSLSDGRGWLVYAQEVESATSLGLSPWPAEAGLSREPAQAAQWEGRFVAGGAALDRQDVLHGACLLWVGDGASLRLEAACWQVKSGHEYTEKSRQQVGWDATNEIAQAIVRVNLRGEPAFLIQDQEGSWSYCDLRGCKPLPGPLATTKFPLDLAFISGEINPALICAEQGKGFRIVTLEGEPVPGVQRG